MTCQTCSGAGHVRGHWMPELCPACSGMKEWNEPEPEVEDKDAKGCLAVTAAFAGVCFGLLLIWLWDRISWVFA